MSAARQWLPNKGIPLMVEFFDYGSMTKNLINKRTHSLLLLLIMVTTYTNMMLVIERVQVRSNESLSKIRKSNKHLGEPLRPFVTRYIRMPVTS
ncbi:hypothetical protein KIN20_020727 [Parelaphostrongylus tenuis]|uniref:Uncharacterized protein n=1 Tax=Parelaphostrongylus tenuis TaxID=148309 RepID=A0AAD5QTT2_PARTN|nr:hypothetical protein KIN20_020727 [Parelaphostrongylus tenuis]